MIQHQLFSVQDIAYKEFNSKLIPTVDPNRVIGVRTPALRAYAKSIKNTPEAGAFIYSLPHKYFEEDNLHAFLIEQIRDYDACIKELNRFLPYIDNWATCDSMHPKCFGKNKAKLFSEIEMWLTSDHIYTVRYGIGMLMTHFLDESFDVRFPEAVAGVADVWKDYAEDMDGGASCGARSAMGASAAENHGMLYFQKNYYVNMMAAWYFATALAKQYENIIPYLENHRLPVWVHNKTIQKAIESYRITPEQKAYLRELRAKV
ncbi:MAG: DNA alkylation repair protein [Blautia sp.]|nr:DNA alkylation repair protein [Blautia sp.]